MRISFLILLLNAFLLTQAASAVDENTKVKGALLKAMKTHDTEMVNAIASGGYESIDRDDVLQEKIYNYLEAEHEQAVAAQKKAEADALAEEKAKKAAEEKAKQDAIAAEKKKKADAVAKQNASAAAAAALVAKKASDAKKKKEAAAAKKRADAKRKADKKAAAEKKKRDAAAKKKRDAAAAEKKKKQTQAAEKKRKEAVARKKAAPKKAAPKKVTPKKTAPKKTAAPKKVAAPKAVAAPAAVAATAAAANAPVTVSNKKLVGTWKQISSEKVITLSIKANTDFTLEQVEDDGTLTIMGKWKSEENILMLSIRKVQRNVHTRETDIHRIYKVERLSKHRLVLKDKRNRVAYDLKR